MKLAYPLLFVLLIAASGCRNYFIAHDFEAKTTNHKTVAVLPVKMIFTGNKPKKLTEEQIKEIEEAESLAFQTAFHDEILASTRGGKKPIRVNFQSYTETRKILKDNNISIRQSWDEDPKVLAQMLGVDAVVRMEITKKRYISDLASFGIQVTRDVVNVLTSGAGWVLGGVSRLGRTNDVFASAKLINMSDGTVLWSKSDTRSTDWSNPAENVVRYMCRRMAVNFPYRIK